MNFCAAHWMLRSEVLPQSGVFLTNHHEDQMKKLLSISAVIALGLSLAGCGGFWRGFSSWKAAAFSADWIVVQNDYQMNPKMCWRLRDTSITNEDKSDGVYWLDPKNSHLVHISGWYNRVQVSGGDWNSAAATLGVDLAKCTDGRYQP